jgi:hypothetical protein
MTTPARLQRSRSAPAAPAAGDGAAPSAVPAAGGERTAAAVPAAGGERTAAAVPAAAGGSPEFAARLVPLDAGFYAFSLAPHTGWREPVVGLPLPAVHVCPPPDRDGIEITDNLGRAGPGRVGAWLGGRCSTLFVKAPPGGGAALVTAYLSRDPEAHPLQLEIRRIDPGDVAFAASPVGPGVSPGGTPAPIMTLAMGAAAAPPDAMQPVRLEIVAHIRGRGDIRFGDSLWIGRLGPGLWIEAFTLWSRDQSVAGAIEYKGLSASGTETPWVACGSPCGTTGQGIPLVGFAVRQRGVPGGALFDCEYAGYFGSGTVAGPVRNGAPCRSSSDNDPLEGMQLRVTRRPPRTTAIAPAG